MDELFKWLCVGFALSCTIHNLEEAIFLPEWARKHIPNLPFAPNNKIYSVLTSTISAFIWLVIWAALNIESSAIQNLLIAICLAMAINAIFPHLAISLIKKSYSPGTLSGVLSNLPIGAYLISHIIKMGHIPNWSQVTLFALLYAVVSFGALYFWHFRIGASKKGRI